MKMFAAKLIMYICIFLSCSCSHPGDPVINNNGYEHVFQGQYTDEKTLIIDINRFIDSIITNNEFNHIEGVLFNDDYYNKLIARHNMINNHDKLFLRFYFEQYLILKLAEKNSDEINAILVKYYYGDETIFETEDTMFLMAIKKLDPYDEKYNVYLVKYIGYTIMKKEKDDVKNQITIECSKKRCGISVTKFKKINMRGISFWIPIFHDITATE